MLIAYVDESARRRRDEATSVYTLAAVLVDASAVPEVRDAMMRLRYGKSPVVHWRLERAERRAAERGETLAAFVVGLLKQSNGKSVSEARRDLAALFAAHDKGRNRTPVGPLTHTWSGRRIFRSLTRFG